MKSRHDIFAFFLTFGLLAIFWLIFSGRFDAFHLMLGAGVCFVVAFFSHDLLFQTPINRRLFLFWLSFLAYIPYLIRQIIKSNIHVMCLVFHPRMKDLINPHIIEFNSRLKSDMARTTFANSITLTPGTITVDADVMGRFSVHCIDDASGQDLPGEMEERIARVFRE